MAESAENLNNNDNGENYSAKLSIRPLTEPEIKEMDYNGVETITHPLTMSESLTDLANGIDFMAVGEDYKDVPIDEGNSDHVIGAAALTAVSTASKTESPFEGIKKSLQKSLDEMNLLCDTLAITLNRSPHEAAAPVQGGAGSTSAENPNKSSDERYLVLHTAVKEPEPDRRAFQLASKKRCLAEASNILLGGAANMRKFHWKTNEDNSYHHQLLKLRKLWRVHKVGDRIRGDLSFLSVGSNFPHPATFDVVKTTVDRSNVATNMEENYFTAPLSTHPPFTVNICSDLEGDATIRISLKHYQSGDENMLLSGDGGGGVFAQSSIEYHDYLSSASPQFNGRIPEWHLKLCRAQHVLFCKELFDILTYQAIRYTSDGAVGPFIVIGNSLSGQIFADTELLIEYCNSKQTDNIKQEQQPPSARKIFGASVDNSTEDLFYIKDKLVKLLQKSHHKNLNVETPKPSCAVMGLTNETRLATVSPSAYKNLMASAEANEHSLLEYTIMLAKLHVVRRRVRDSIESVQANFTDVRLQSSNSTIVSGFSHTTKVVISSTSPDEKPKNICMLIANSDYVKGHYNNEVEKFRPVHDNIQSFLLNCICLHQTSATKLLAGSLGWKCVFMSPFSGIDTCHGDHRAMLLSSSTVDLSVSVRFLCSLKRGFSFEISVKSDVTLDMLTDELLFDERAGGGVDGGPVDPVAADMAPFSGVWQNVNCDALPGTETFSQKLAYVLMRLNTKYAAKPLF